MYNDISFLDGLKEHFFFVHFPKLSYGKHKPLSVKRRPQEEEGQDHNNCIDTIVKISLFILRS